MTELEGEIGEADASWGLAGGGESGVLLLLFSMAGRTKSPPSLLVCGAPRGHLG